MYVCLCHGFTDRDVRRTMNGADASVAEVYRALGCTPRCGKCVPTVCRMVKSVTVPVEETAPL